MQEKSALVLEIFKHAETLKMSLFEQAELASTLRHYSQCAVSFKEIDALCQEAASILGRVSKKDSGVLDFLKSLSKTGQLLYDHLLTRQVKEKLRISQNLDLILSIEEELINIPWELLYDGNNFLCLTFNLGRLVRTKNETSILQYRSSPSALSMLILANPSGDLKSAYLEGVNIKNQFDRRRNTVRIDFKSTSIDKLYVKKNFCDYDIVHFAGHCEHESDDPKNSGWILSDGRFSAEDILKLGTGVSLPTLVFSNACHSASSGLDLMDADYQGKAYNLASAFLFAGVRHYIGAIRRIEDPVSLFFAKEFYAQLISGKTIGECLRLSRLRLVKEYGISSVHWAGYLLYGDPTFILFRRKIKPAAGRLKRDIFWRKRTIAGFFAFLAVMSICIYLYIWLPSINPGTYYLFLKSKGSFLRGKNQEAIFFSGQIIKKDPLFLAAYSLLGDAYYRLGDQENALKYYFEYALHSEKRHDKKNLANAYCGIGWIYHLQGEYSKALDFYNQALTLSRLDKNKLTEADVLGKLAVWHIDKKEYDKALELLTKSSEINRERQNIYKHKYNLACDYFNFGLLFTDKDDFATAKEFYAKSFNLFNKLKLKYELSDYYFNVGEIYKFQKEYQKALDYYSKGLEIDMLQGNKPNIASDYSMLGELYAEMDNFSEAEIFFNRACALSKEINARPELALGFYNLGILYKNAGKKAKAREYLRQAQEIYATVDLAMYQEIKKELLGLSGG
ncbi:MAG: tetratricopeptide repeat protein [Candidatus Omnitrophica bacterium]|nr:tetratricopeptide repeat protein [Candidatus Omnitrophota bacterium]